jgi:hypothetical protein
LPGLETTHAEEGVVEVDPRMLENMTISHFSNLYIVDRSLSHWQHRGVSSCSAGKPPYGKKKKRNIITTKVYNVETLERRKTTIVV